MADDKLGTLEYEMKISEDELTKSLKRIDELLKVQDDKWKKALANVGGAANFNIDTSKLITANKAVEAGTTNLKTSIKQLKKELNDNITTYEKYSQAQRENTTYGAKTLATIQDQKNKLAELGEAYRAQITKERELIRERNRLAAESRNIAKLQSVVDTAPNEIAKIKAINKELEYQKTLKQNTGNQDALNKEIVANQALITKKQNEIKLNERLIAQELQRQKILSTQNQYPAGTVGNINAQIELAKFEKSIISKSDNDAINKQSALIKQLNEQKKQLLATEKQQAAQQRANLQQDKLKAAVQSQEVGSIARLRAEYALLAFQYGQVGKTIPFTTQKVKELTTAMAQNRAQMAQLQPTLGMWGKLVSAIRTYATAYLSVQAVMGLGRAVFTQTKELDQLAFSMQTVIKSSTELAQTQKFLSDIAINYGGDLLTLSERYIKFRAAAMQSNISAGETQKIYDSVSKAAGTLGLKTDELSGVYLALEQMISKGKVTTEELRRQLGERLPGAFGIMANALGVTIPQLDKMLKKGEVMSKDALPKFAAALEKAYGLDAVKKIDTLAAAQGRMSTQFTMLIKEIGASDSFKGIINSLASFLGFIKENLAVIGFFAKAFIVLTTAVTLNKLAVAVSIPIQKALLLTFGSQTTALTQLTFAQMRLVVAQRAATIGTTAWARAWNSLKLAFASNPLGAVLTAITLLGTALYMIIKRSKETSEATLSFSEQVTKAKKNIDNLFASMGEAGTESNRYKDAISQVNVMLAKYNIGLVTSKSSVDDLTEAHKRLKTALVEEMFIKERASRIDKADADLNKTKAEVLTGLLDRKVFDPAVQREAFNAMLDLAEDSSISLFEKTNKIFKEFGGDKNSINVFLGRLSVAAGKFRDEMARINTELPEIIKPDIKVFNIDDLKAAKKEFEELAKLQKVGGEATLERTFSTGYANYKQYLESLLKLDYLTAEQRKEVYLELAEFEKKARGTGKDPRLESLKQQFSLLEKMKAEYDKLTKVVTPDLALSKVLDAFAPEMEKLKFTITPQLDTEGFGKVLNDFANAVAKYDKEFAASIREKIPVEFTEDIAEKFKKMFQAINDEIDRFTEKDELRKSIFDITGDMELAIKLTTDKKEVTDIVQYMKDEVQKVAKAAGFDNSFEELTAMLNDPKMTADLKKAIEDIQKYVADKSKSILLDALKFIYTGIPEGVDIQFDFSKVVNKLEDAIREIKTKVETIKAEPALLSQLGLDESEIERLKNMQINAANEVAKNATEKLSKDYIKESLPEQLKNDFEDMQDASIQSLGKIIEQIDIMKQKLLGGETVTTLFDAAKLDKEQFSAELDLLINTGDIDEFNANIDKLKVKLADMKQLADTTKISKNTPEDIAKFQILIDLLEALGVSLKVAGDEAQRSWIKKFVVGVKELQGEISNVIDSVSELSDAFGIGLSESGKKSLDAIKSAATGIFQVIEAAGKLAEKEMDAVEKASAILAIISAVMKIATGIASAIRASSEETESLEQGFLDIAYQYNKALRERNVLLEQAKTIFGTDEYGAAVSQIVKMDEAQKNVADSLQKIADIQTKTGTKWWSGIAQGLSNILTFGLFDDIVDKNDDKLESILTRWPELIKDGILNLDLARSIVSDANSGLSEDGQRVLQEGIDAVEMYNEALLTFKDYMGSIFGTLGNDLMTAITENLDATTNALDDFTKYASSALEKLFSDLAYSMYLAPIFARLQKQVEDAYTDQTPDDAAQILNLFKQISPEIAAGMEGASDFIKTMRNAAKQTGFDIFQSATDELSGISKGIKGVTEDTARRLEGLINTIRETGVKNLGNTSEILNSTQMTVNAINDGSMKYLERADALLTSSQMIQAYSGQSLAKLTNIDNNIALQLALFNNLMSPTGTTGLGGLRVVVQ